MFAALVGTLPRHPQHRKNTRPLAKEREFFSSPQCDLSEGGENGITFDIVLLTDSDVVFYRVKFFWRL